MPFLLPNQQRQSTEGKLLLLHALNGLWLTQVVLESRPLNGSKVALVCWYCVF